MKKKDFYARNFVRSWFTTENVTVLPHGTLRIPNSTKTKQDIINKLCLDYKEQRADYNSKQLDNRQKVGGVEKSDLVDAANELISDEMERLRQELRDKLKCTGENLDPIRKFVHVINPAATELDVHVMAHFCWQVKRKLFGKQVKWHLMPILVGEQGTGKTTALLRLFEPLNEYFLKLNFEQMAEPSMRKSYSTNYIVFNDELSNAERADINMLKELITAEKSNFRVLYTHDVESTPMNCTFIAASNKSVDLLIRDNTGMRRFYELSVPLPLVHKDVQALDIDAIWAGIDENRDLHYTANFMNELNRAQQQLTDFDEYNEFVIEYKLAPQHGEPTEEVSSAWMFQTYKEWAEANGYKVPSNHYFGKKMKSLGLTSARFTLPDGRQTRGYNVSAGRVKQTFDYHNVSCMNCRDKVKVGT